MKFKKKFRRDRPPDSDNPDDSYLFNAAQRRRGFRVQLQNGQEYILTPAQAAAWQDDAAGAWLAGLDINNPADEERAGKFMEQAVVRHGTLQMDRQLPGPGMVMLGEDTDLGNIADHVSVLAEAACTPRRQAEQRELESIQRLLEEMKASGPAPRVPTPRDRELLRQYEKHKAELERLVELPEEFCTVHNCWH
jgi:hypothetical protein